VPLLEIEAKFDLLDDHPEAFERVLARLRHTGYQVQKTSPDRFIEDTYFDTSDFHIESLPGSLRLRRKGPEHLLTFKQKVTSEKGVLSRVELEAAPTIEHLQRVRQALLEADWFLADEQIETELNPEQILKCWGFHPILQIHNSRSSYSILHEANLCCTLTRDHVQFQDRELSVPYTGIEIEAAKADSRSDVLSIADDLKLTFPDLLRPQAATKYEMGLRLLHLK
jgi:inorganic triphosphatase YgiF